MGKLGDLLNDLGFNEEASLDVKTAFVRHLVQAAKEASPQNISPISKQTETTSKNQKTKSRATESEEIQLSFDPDLLRAK